MLNALPLCEGSITRERRTTKGTEKGILDFFVVCERILPMVTKMVIDEKGQNALTRYRGGKIVKADHNMLKLEIDLKFHIEGEHDRTEMFNLRDKVGQQQFKVFTTETERFTKCFSTKEAFEVQFKNWQKQFKKSLHANFRKIRIKGENTKVISQIDILINKKRAMLKKKHMTPHDMENIENIDVEISKECEEKEWEKLQKVVKELDSSESNTTMWKQMRKSFPKKLKPLPCGVKNIEGKLITNPKEKEKVILEHFTHRMRKRPVKLKCKK